MPSTSGSMSRGVGKLSAGAAEERPVGAGAGGDVREKGDQFPGRVLVGREVVDAAQVVVVHAGGGRRFLRGHVAHPRNSCTGMASLRINSKMRRYSSTSAASSRYRAPTCDSR